MGKIYRYLARRKYSKKVNKGFNSMMFEIKAVYRKQSLKLDGNLIKFLHHTLPKKIFIQKIIMRYIFTNYTFKLIEF